MEKKRLEMRVVSKTIINFVVRQVESIIGMGSRWQSKKPFKHVSESDIEVLNITMALHGIQWQKRSIQLTKDSWNT